jgi:hypothetical protein
MEGLESFLRSLRSTYPSVNAIMDKYYELFRGDAKGKDKAGSSSDPIEVQEQGA